MDIIVFLVVIIIALTSFIVYLAKKIPEPPNSFETSLEQVAAYILEIHKDKDHYNDIIVLSHWTERDLVKELLEAAQEYEKLKNCNSQP